MVMMVGDSQTLEEILPQNISSKALGNEIVR